MPTFPAAGCVIEDPLQILLLLDELYKADKNKPRNNLTRTNREQQFRIHQDFLWDLNPHHPDFEKELRKHIPYLLCFGTPFGDHVQQSINNLGGVYINNTIKQLISSLNTAYQYLHLARYFVPGEFDRTIGLADTEEENLPKFLTRHPLYKPTASPSGTRNTQSRQCSLLYDVGRSLTVKEKELGYVYIAVGRPNQLCLTNDRDYVKIGFTLQDNAYKRMGSIMGKCGFQIIFKEERRTLFAKRIEGLVHAELRIRGLWRPHKCGECKNPDTGDPVKHREWFEIDPSCAIQTLAYWVTWLERYEPYCSGGFLSHNSFAKMLSGRPTRFLEDSTRRVWHHARGTPNSLQCCCIAASKCSKRKPASSIQAVPVTAAVPESNTAVPTSRRDLAPASKANHWSSAPITPARALAASRRSVAARQRQHEDGDVISTPDLSPSNSADSVCRASFRDGLDSCPPTPTPNHEENLASQITFSQDSYFSAAEEHKDSTIEAILGLPEDDMMATRTGVEPCKLKSDLSFRARAKARATKQEEKLLSLAKPEVLLPVATEVTSRMQEHSSAIKTKAPDTASASEAQLQLPENSAPRRRSSPRIEEQQRNKRHNQALGGRRSSAA